MNKYFLDGEYERIRLIPIRMAFSREIGEVGKAGIGKVVHLMVILFRILLARICHKPDVLYYPPAGADKVPFLRDCVLLITTRWMFPRVVFHFHAAGLPGLYQRLSAPLRFLFHRAYDYPDVAMSISAVGLSDAEFLKAKRAVVVPNGIPDIWSGRPEKEPNALPKILFLSMVCKEKGVGDLIEACRLLRDRGLDFRCQIAGGAASEEELRGFQAQAESLGGQIEFLGSVTGEAKWNLFAGADIFCFPTQHPTETFGIVLLEAMMAGLPVVATDWRAIPEIVVEGETGLLVPVRDPAATADRLARLLQDPEMRQRMGQAGRRRFLEKYTVETFRKNMQQAMLEVRG